MGEQQGRWRGVALAGEDVDDDRRGMDAVIARFATSGLDSLKAVLRHAGQDLDHLPITVIAALQLAPDRGHGSGQGPVPEGRAIAQRSGFARQNRHIMPRIINGLASSEDAGMLADDHAVLPNGDAVGIGMHLDRTADSGGQHRVLSNRTVQVLATDAGALWKPSKGPA